MENRDNKAKSEARIRCKGECFREKDGTQHRCEAYGRHEWCENYMVRLSAGSPEYFEEK